MEIFILKIRKSRLEALTIDILLRFYYYNCAYIQYKNSLVPMQQLLNVAYKIEKLEYTCTLRTYPAKNFHRTELFDFVQLSLHYRNIQWNKFHPCTVVKVTIINIMLHGIINKIHGEKISPKRGGVKIYSR